MDQIFLWQLTGWSNKFGTREKSMTDFLFYKKNVRQNLSKFHLSFQQKMSKIRQNYALNSTKKKSKNPSKLQLQLHERKSGKVIKITTLI